MLKFISPAQLRLGMYVQSFAGKWRLPRDWRTPFLLDKESDLLALKKSPLREILIDTLKGLDVMENEDKQEHEEESIDRVSTAHDQEGTSIYNKKTELQQEREEAARVLFHAEKTIVNMFSEARMGQSIDLQAAGDLVSEISASVTRNANALITLARIKTSDNYTYMHSVAVCAMMISLSNRLGLSAAEREQAGMAGLLHDIGKIRVPNYILNKSGPLSAEEFAVMKTHSLVGYSLLKATPKIGSAPLDVSLHHHERMDGTGYPYQLPGEKISLVARMGAICDVYDALTSDRPYKAAWDPARSLQHMAQSKGQFDFAVLRAFVSAIGIYPIGSYVNLQSGHLAIVLNQQPGHLLAPVVKIFYSLREERGVTPTLVDLKHVSDKIVGHADPGKLRQLANLLVQQDLSY